MFRRHRQQRRLTTSLAVYAALYALTLLAGCQRNNETDALRQPPLHFESGDECHVCGMIIVQFPGPKGQAYLRGTPKPVKFCSTQELFIWLNQPETGAVVQHIYVHDMAQSDWQHPRDSRLIDARDAWYVVGSRQLGAMGTTPASFAEQHAAQQFARQYGGRVVRFDAIDLAVLQENSGH